MYITQRRYKQLVDFNKVHTFLTENYSIEKLNSYFLPQFYEYAQTHPHYNYSASHRIGLWEKNDKLIGLATYEMRLGECFLIADKKHTDLFPEMLAYTERELSVLKDNQKTLSVWITSTESEKVELLREKGYQKVHSQPITIFSYDTPLPEIKLPEGFTFITLEDENDLSQINACLWKGFNHGDMPDGDINGQLLMQSGPKFRKDLATIIKAPDGEYACYCGMWIDDKNKYAYLEPLATIPKHRKKGLATYALTESMRKTKKLGAEYCFGGGMKYYSNLGFKTICNRELWKKVLI